MKQAAVVCPAAIVRSHVTEDAPTQTESAELWQELEQRIDAGNIDELAAFVEALPAGEAGYAVARLDEPKQIQLLEMLPAELARWLIEHFADEQAARLIERVPTESAAAILDELESDDQADVLNELDEESAQAILSAMDPEEATDARKLVEYDPDTAGGIMVTEYLSYPSDQSVSEVIADLREYQEDYAEYLVQYVYVTDRAGVLVGVCRLQDLMLAPGRSQLGKMMIDQPMLAVQADVHLDELEDIFDHHDVYAVPVVDETGLLVGAVRRAAVREAIGERSDKAMLRSSGIIAGEEYRSMPAGLRAMRRLVFLVPNILLSVISISVIAAYEDIVQKVVALAIFLPMVAGLGGNAANQAIAVSMRELSLDIARPSDVKRVIYKELTVGLLTGLALGIIVWLVAWAWRGNFYLGIVVGGALPVSVVVASAFGGAVPLALKGLKVDPAMATGPVVSTTVDLCSFLATLMLAMALVDYL